MEHGLGFLDGDLRPEPVETAEKESVAVVARFEFVRAQRRFERLVDLPASGEELRQLVVDERGAVVPFEGLAIGRDRLLIPSLELELAPNEIEEVGVAPFEIPQRFRAGWRLGALRLHRLPAQRRAPARTERERTRQHRGDRQRAAQAGRVVLERAAQEFRSPWALRQVRSCSTHSSTVPAAVSSTSSAALGAS